MSGISILLPWPPSRNALWRAVSMGRARVMMKSRQYKDWWKDAEVALASQEHHRTPGPVTISLDLHPPTKREYDPDNYSKAILDFLVWSSLIDGDTHKTIKKITTVPFDKGIREWQGVWAHIDPAQGDNHGIKQTGGHGEPEDRGVRAGDPDTGAAGGT